MTSEKALNEFHDFAWQQKWNWKTGTEELEKTEKLMSNFMDSWLEVHARSKKLSSYLWYNKNPCESSLNWYFPRQFATD